MSPKIDLNKFKDVVGQLKTKQKQLQSLMNKETLKEAKKYAEASGKELKNLIQTTDVKKVKTFIEKEAKEIQKLQKQIPSELAKFSKFVSSQKKEFEKILKTLNGKKPTRSPSKKSSESKKTAPVATSATEEAVSTETPVKGE